MNRNRPVLVWILLVYGELACGAPVGPYELVMSKNDKLCETMANLYNEDMNSQGEIKYETHEIFKRIPWRSVDLDEKKYPTYGCSYVKHAHFDINNDAKDELVVKHSGCFRSQLTDSLFIFPSDSDILLNIKPGPGGLAALLRTPNKFNQNGYDLTQEPGAVIGGVFVLQPFIWGATSYISMTDLHQEWIVIAKYKRAEEMQDVCYFHGPDALHHK